MTQMNQEIKMNRHYSRGLVTKGTHYSPQLLTKALYQTCCVNDTSYFTCFRYFITKYVLSKKKKGHMDCLLMTCVNRHWTYFN